MDSYGSRCLLPQQQEEVFHQQKECKVVPTRIGWFLEYDSPFKYGFPYDNRRVSGLLVLCVQRTEFKIVPSIENLRQYLEGEGQGVMFVHDILAEWETAQQAILEVDKESPEEDCTEALDWLTELARNRFKVSIPKTKALKLAKMVTYLSKHMELHMPSFIDSMFRYAIEYTWWV